MVVIILTKEDFNMENNSISLLGLAGKNIDYEKSYDYVDPTTHNHIIECYLIKGIYDCCPNCGSVSLVSNGSKTSTILYSTTYEDVIYMNVHQKRFKCKDCAKHFYQKNPFIDQRNKVSINTELKIVLTLQKDFVTYKNVAQRFKLTTPTVIDIFNSRVNCERLSLEPVICFDEIYLKKVGINKYAFVIYTPYKKKIIDIHFSRYKNDLIQYFNMISENERAKVEYICIDLYQTYHDVAKIFFPNAKIAADSFHVIKNLNKAFETIRIRVMKNFKPNTYDGKQAYYLYKHHNRKLLTDWYKDDYDKHYFKYLNTYLTYQEVVEKILSLSSDLKLAYELKEEYRNFNSSATIDNANVWFDEILDKFYHCHIKEFHDFSKTLKRWKNEILNSIHTYNGHRISNGPIEGMNNRIKTYIHSSFGVINFKQFRNRIMYVVNDNSIKAKPIKNNKRKK